MQTNVRKSSVKKMKKCVLDPRKLCDNCNQCNRCDLDPSKLCDNCFRCLDMGEEDYAKISISRIVLDEDDVVPFGQMDEETMVVITPHVLCTTLYGARGRKRRG